MKKVARTKKLAEAPLTEYEKDRARTMMRNNRRFQALGIPAIVGMMRRSSGQECSALTTDESASVITQGESSDYNVEEQLERSQHQAEVMREEMAAMKKKQEESESAMWKKQEEAEAAQAARDKSFELLLKKAEENDARYNHMLALLSSKAL